MASLYKRPIPGTSQFNYYLQFYLPGKKQRRVNLHTTSEQIAKLKLYRFEVAKAEEHGNPLPTKSPVADVIAAYARHIRSVKTAKSAQTDIYYLRDVFGPICDALKVTSRTVSQKTKKRPPKDGQDRRCRASVLEPPCFEQITTAEIAHFIASRMQSRGLAPKTANRYREILTRLFNWSKKNLDIKLAGGINPAAAVERYTEPAPVITFLSLQQIEAQLNALTEQPTIQAMVATYVYAGLRREELLWLTHDDIDWDAKPFGRIRIRAKSIRGETWQPKTKTNRSVPIGSQLRPFLDKQRMRAARSLWLFPSPEGKRWDPDNFSAALREGNKAATLSWTCLHFRHTFGSQLAIKGESLFKISKLMGNSPEICRRHYAALNTEELTDTVEFQTVNQSSVLVAAEAS